MIDFSKYKTSQQNTIDFSKYKTPEPKPITTPDSEKDTKINFDNYRTVSLPEHLGGGEYKTAGAGTLQITPRDYAGMPTREGSERDHIMSVFLGGTSSLNNLQYLETTKEGRQEGKVSVEQQAYNDYKSGEISLEQARLRVATKQQQIKGLTPTEKEQTWQGQLIPAVKDLPKTVWNKVKSSFTRDPNENAGAIIQIASEAASDKLGREIRPENYAEEMRNLSLEEKREIQNTTKERLTDGLKEAPEVARNTISAIGAASFSSEFKEQRGEAFSAGTLQTSAALKSTLSKGVEVLGLVDLRNRLQKSAQEDIEGAEIINSLRNNNINIEDERAFVDKIQDPEFVATGLFQNIPNLLFAMGVAAPAAVIAAPALVTGGILFGATASLEGGFAYNEAKQMGATEEEATKAATLTGIANGILEALPIWKLFSRTPITKKLKQSFTRKVVSRITDIFNRAKGQALTEASTESLQEIVANSAALVYDENRDIFSGVDEAAFFATLIGGGSSIIVDTVQLTRDMPVGLSIEDVSKNLDNIFKP